MQVFATIDGIEFFYTSFDRIYVSKCGKILFKAKNNKTGSFSLRLKKIYVTPDGYCTTSIEGKIVRVHRLIAQTFLQNPENKPEVNHKDCNKQNNHINNLEWVTSEENIAHAIANGKIKKISDENTNVHTFKKSDILRIKNDMYRQIKNMDFIELTHTTEEDIGKLFSKYFNIKECEGVRIKCKDAINILRNDLITVKAIKNFLSTKFKIVNIHGILFYKNLSIERIDQSQSISDKEKDYADDTV